MRYLSSIFCGWFSTLDLDRKRKHVMKEKRKIRDRLALKMILPGDIHDHETNEGGKNDQGLFDLEKIKTRKVSLRLFAPVSSSLSSRLFQQLMEISSALPDLNFNFGQDMNEDDEDDDVHLGQDKRRIPRVSYDKDKNNGDMSSIDIYKPFLDDDDEDEDDEEGKAPIPFESERYQPKLDR